MLRNKQNSGKRSFPSIVLPVEFIAITGAVWFQFGFA